MNRELLMRIGTATVGIPLCLGLIWFKLEGLLILATCLSGLGLFEFYVAFDTGFKKRILAIIGFPFFLFCIKLYKSPFCVHIIFIPRSKFYDSIIHSTSKIIFSSDCLDSMSSIQDSSDFR